MSSNQETNKDKLTDNLVTYQDKMRAVIDIEARKVKKEPLKETYSERRVRIDDKKSVQAINSTKMAAKKAVKGKKQHSIKGWINTGT